jgi:hypothetical protein
MSLGLSQASVLELYLFLFRFTSPRWLQNGFEVL